MAFLEIIQGDDPVTAGEKYFRDDATDIAGGAGHENIQRGFSLMKRSDGKVRVYSSWDTVPMGSGAWEHQQRKDEKRKRRTGPLPPVRRLLCASNVFPVRMFQQFPPIRLPETVKLIFRIDYPSSL